MLQKCSLWRVAGIFCTYPTTSQSVADISRTLNLAHTSVNLHLAELLKQELIAKQKIRRGSRIFAVYTAQQNKEFRQHKQLNNLHALQDAMLIEHLQDTLAPKSIVVFGSYRRGEDIEDSDIDIFVESTQKPIDLRKYEKILRRKIQIHFKEEFSSLSKELKNNILNGIVLRGYLEAIK